MSFICLYHCLDNGTTMHFKCDLSVMHVEIECCIHAFPSLKCVHNINVITCNFIQFHKNKSFEK